MQWRTFDHRQRRGQLCLLGGGVFLCGYCRGSGVASHTRNLACRVCGGDGLVEVDGPAVNCPFCKGSGRAKRGAAYLCPVCAGKGVLSVPMASDVCPACGGAGRELGGKLACRVCRGAGYLASGHNESQPKPGRHLVDEGPRALAHKLGAVEPAMGLSPLFSGRTRRGRALGFRWGRGRWPRKTAEDPLERRLKEREQITREMRRWQREERQYAIPPSKISMPKQETGHAAEGGEGDSPHWCLLALTGNGLVGWDDDARHKEHAAVRKPNSAALARMMRRVVARERAVALGRRLAGPRASLLEQAAADWERRQEERQRLLQREEAMLEEVVWLMKESGAFDADPSRAQWSRGRLACSAERVAEVGWRLVVTNTGGVRLPLRGGSRDLEGVYEAELDSSLNIKSHCRLAEGAS